MSEMEELNAICEKIPEATAVQLRAWALQVHVVQQLYPHLTDARRPAPKPDKVTLELYWWGLHFAIPERVMAAYESERPAVNGFAAGVEGCTRAAAPFVPLAGAYVVTELPLMKAVDRGRGVNVSMAWAAPGIFALTAI